MTRYLSGLCVAGLGLCGGGWLIAAGVIAGGQSAGPAGPVNLLTGTWLAVASSVSLGCWAAAWRRRMRVDGVLTDRFLHVSRRQARRNRRELSRDVARTARLAKRSARESRRGARRAARRAVRLADGGDVLSSGAGLGSAPGGDGPYSVSVPPVPVPAPVPAAMLAPAVPGEVPGESAVDLLNELRAMLVPLLTATSPAVPAVPAPAVAPLPRRVPAGAPAPRPPVPAPEPEPSPVPAAPPGGEGLMFAPDGEEAWW